MKLKDPYTLRIFISSPFNGMEAERVSLSKLCWPRIESALMEKGIQLRTVDMRWGITSENSSDAQTINICLREIDRSDMFVGFFGQRYGWSGADDKDLQENFENALERFPWLEGFRDRSVTELEFLQGHLNNPGGLPAVICFRDKSYDDKLREEAVAEGNQRNIKKYSAESEQSIYRMNDLKRRVEESEAKTLGINMAYVEPAEFAEFVFEHFWDCIKNDLLANMSAEVQDKVGSLASHEAFKKTKQGIYIGGEESYKVLDALVENKENRLMTICSERGYGKSGLLANWSARQRVEGDANVKLCYYYVQADSESADTTNMLLCLTEQIYYSVLKKAYTKPTIRDLGSLTDDFRACLVTVGAQYPDIVLVIAICAIDMLDVHDKTAKHVFWLMNPPPDNVRFILTLNTDSPISGEILEVLQSDHQTEILKIQPMKDEHKRILCNELLNMNSKSVSSEQMELLVSSEKTSQPLFLVTVIEELCVYGTFRKLTDQIKDLLSSDSIKGLVVKILERLESDYNPPDYKGNMVKDILGSIRCCKVGLSESEIPLPDYQWTPLYYGIKKILTNRNGTLGFSMEDFKKAVTERYLTEEESRKHVFGYAINIFQTDYQTAIENHEEPSDRCITELCHLWYSSGDMDSLLAIISRIGTFNMMTNNDSYTLLLYWQSLAIDDKIIARRYIKSLDLELAKRYTKNLDEYGDLKSQEDIDWEEKTLHSLAGWFNGCKLYKGNLMILHKTLTFQLRRSDISGVDRDRRVSGAKSNLACLYCEMEKYKEAISLHNDVLTIRKRLHEQGHVSKEEVGSSYHGLGACYLLRAQHDEAERFFLKTYDLQKDGDDDLNICDVLTNLANIYNKKEEREKARDTYLKCIRIREEKEIAQLTLDMAYLYNNLGLVYRGMNEYDNAETYYQKSLKVKEKILGRMSLDVAYSLMNLGTLESCRSNFPNSLEYNAEVLEIFKKLSPDSEMVTMTEENIVLTLINMGRFEEAEPTYLHAFDTLMGREDKLARGIGYVHREMVNYYARGENWSKAGEITTALIESGLGNERDYGLLDMVDSNLQVRPDRPPHLTLDEGLRRFPESPMLLNAKIKNLIPGGTEAIMKFTTSHCESQSPGEDYGKRHMVTGSLLAITHHMVPEALLVLEAGRKYAPNNKLLEDLIEEVKGYLPPAQAPTELNES